MKIKNMNNIQQMYFDKQKRIDKYFNEKQESIKFSVAQNNAVLIVSALIQKGELKYDADIEEKLERYTRFLYEMR
jgi:hypothetical protein